MSAEPQHQHPPHAQRTGTVRALLRLREYARPALPAIAARHGSPPCSPSSSRSRSRRCCSRSSTARSPTATPAPSCPLALLVLGLGVLEARAHRAAPLVRAHARHPRRGAHAQRALREAAGPAGELPRPLAERPAALARRERPQPDPPLARRSASCCSSSTSSIDRRRRRHPDLDELDARARSSCVVLGAALDRRLRASRAATRRCRAAARTRRATSRPPSRSRCTASACSRRSGAASTRSRRSARRPRRCAAPRSRRRGSIASIWLWLIAGARRRARAVPRASASGSPSQGQLSVGELVAFFATATVLRWPIESIGFLLVVHARRAHRDRPVLRGPRRARTRSSTPSSRATIARAARRARRSTTCTSATRTRPTASATCSTASTSCCEPGETMALVGLTGCGKTTLTALTTRLYDVTGGSVTLDGVDVRALDPRELRTHIAMAFEDATLFSRVGARQRAARPPSELDPRRRRGRARCSPRRSRIAQAGFVYDLPDGVDTKVGEEGLSLSGGQRQRLALARAVAAKPAVLVLDDPLSALDVDDRGARRGRAARGARRRRPRSSSRTARRRSCSPTASRCSRTAGSPRSARHSELLARERALPLRHLEPRGRAKRDATGDEPRASTPTDPSTEAAS